MMSLKKYITTAKNEPMCKLTSIERLLFSKSRNSDIRIKCEEELIGKNSATP